MSPTYALAATFVLLSLGTLASLIVLMVRTRRLQAYLRANRYASWRYITDASGFGPGSQNILKVLKYIRSDADDADERIPGLKRGVATSLRCAAFMFLAALADAAAMVVVQQLVLR